MQLTRLRALGLAVAGALVALPAAGHHSAAMIDRGTTVPLTGTVKEFQWASPHIWIQINVANADGVVEEWSIEGGTPQRLYRSGWRPTTFEAGDDVTILVNPMKDGALAGAFVGAKFSDGSTLGRYSE